MTLFLEDDAYDRFEFAIAFAKDGTLAWGEVDTQAYSFDVRTAYLLDGSFTVLLASLGGDFYINQSDLTITYETYDNGTAPVPEPASMTLFGVGLIGMAG